MIASFRTLTHSLSLANYTHPTKRDRDVERFTKQFGDTVYGSLKRLCRMFRQCINDDNLKINALMSVLPLQEV